MFWKMTLDSRQVLVWGVLLALTGCQQGEVGKTAVTFNLHGDKQISSKISAKTGDLQAYIVVKGDNLTTTATAIPSGESSLTLTVDNGTNRVFQVLVYVDSDFVDPEEMQNGSGTGNGSSTGNNSSVGVPPGTSIVGGALFHGNSDAMTLNGLPVDLTIDVTEATDLVGMEQDVLAANSNNTTDIFQLKGVSIRATDLETGFEYGTFFPKKSGASGYPAAFVKGKTYRLTADFGSSTLEQDVTIPVDATSFHTAPVLTYSFSPVTVSTESELQNAVANANANSGLDFIDIVNTGTPPFLPPLLMDMTATLVLQDPYGLILRGVGSVTLDGGVNGIVRGVQMSSSRNMLSKLNFKGFQTFAVSVDNSLDPAPTFNVIEDCKLSTNGIGGIDVDDALFTFIGPNNIIDDNFTFGIRVGGTAAYALIDQNRFYGNSIALDIVGNASSVTVSSNYFGLDPNVNVYKPNRLGILLDSGSDDHGEIENNVFGCNTELGSTLCPVPGGATLPTLPNPAGYSLSPGGAVIINGPSGSVDVRRNQFIANSRGLVMVKDAAIKGYINHNTFFLNDVGLLVGDNITGTLEVTDNIISNSYNWGIDFAPNSSLLVYSYNLLFNYTSTIDLNCHHANNGPYCVNVILSNLANNQSCAPGVSPCDPSFMQIGGPPGTLPVDLSLNAVSPAVDTGSNSFGGGSTSFLGSAPDKGAIESH